MPLKLITGIMLLFHNSFLITDFATQVDLRVVVVPPTKGSKVTPSNRDEKSTVMTTTMHRQSSSCTEFVGPHDLLDSASSSVSDPRRSSFGGSTSYEFFCRNFSWRRSSKDLDVNKDIYKDSMVGGDKRKSKKHKVT